MLRYSIVIPSRNLENVKASVASLRDREIIHPVFVAWDGNLPDIDFRRSLFADFGVFMFQAPEPFCFGRNCNEAIRRSEHFLRDANNESREEYKGVLLMNDDVKLLTSKGFDTMVAQAEASSEFGLIAPMIDGATCCSEQRVDQQFANDRKADEIIPVQNHMVPFACVYLTAAALQRIPLCPGCAAGPLCEEFFGFVDPDGNQVEGGGALVYGGEDDEACYRLRSVGLKLGLSELCVVDHKSLPSTFRSERPSLPVRGAKAVFKRIHGFDMGER